MSTHDELIRLEARKEELEMDWDLIDSSLVIGDENYCQADLDEVSDLLDEVNERIETIKNR